MTGFDIALILLVGGLALLGLMRGAISEAMSYMGWCFAIYIALNFGAEVAPLLPDSMTEGVTGTVILFVVMIIGTRVMVWVVGSLLRGMVNAVGLSFLDRLLGGAIGFCKGILIGVAFVLIAGLTDLPKKPFWQESMLAPTMVSLAQIAMPHLPDYLVERIEY